MLDFHALYERHAPEVRRFAYYLCGDPTLADDVTSETFVRAWVARGWIRQATVRSYLFTIARNVYRDAGRRARGQEAALSADIPDKRAGAEASLEHASDVQVVLAALRELDDLDRSAVLMRALDEMPYDEIAVALGLSAGAMKVRVHRARMKLMQARTPLGGGHGGP